jgi:pyruvate kinase
MSTATSTLFDRARTKIVATVGPACDAPGMLRELIAAGVDVFRLNMAHGTPEQQERRIAAIRAASEQTGNIVAVLVDLAGPKIRLGELPGGEAVCREGETLRLIVAESTVDPRTLVATYRGLIEDLSPGDRVLLVDGTVSLAVEQIERQGNDYAAICRVVQGGTVRSRQGINLPGVKLHTSGLTPEDRVHARWAAAAGVDFIGQSFVRSAEDVWDLKQLLRGEPTASRVVAKIEKPEALDNLGQIVAAADAVMVARGDLGVEIDVARMAVVQKQIISLCNRMQKPVIVATQMLDSMQRNRRPTRAEATDVANAVLDGADACMLSGETAVGEHPREAVEMMHRIAMATESVLRDQPPRPAAESPIEGLHVITQAMADGASQISRLLQARLVVAASHSGATALAISNRRNYIPTLGLSDQHSTLRQMCLYWGVTPLAGLPTHDSGELIAHVEAWGKRTGTLSSGDRVVIVRGTRLAARVQNALVVHEVG